MGIGKLVPLPVRDWDEMPAQVSQLPALEHGGAVRLPPQKVGRPIYLDCHLLAAPLDHVIQAVSLICQHLLSRPQLEGCQCAAHLALQLGLPGARLREYQTAALQQVKTGQPRRLTSLKCIPQPPLVQLGHLVFRIYLRKLVAPATKIVTENSHECSR
eukprot:scaffold2250_cov147-Isochrysis_galbana.AAC.2